MISMFYTAKNLHILNGHKERKGHRENAEGNGLYVLYALYG